MKVQKTVLAGAGGGRGPAVLLRSVHPIGKLIVGRDVIKLPRRLVEPRAPRLASVVRHDRPLVATQNHALSRSEEHTSELQSRGHLVCRLLLEKKNKGRLLTLPRLVPERV